MHCPCGYSFNESILKWLEDEGERPYESYAVIRDDEYAEFLDVLDKFPRKPAEGEASISERPSRGRLVAQGNLVWHSL